MPPRAVPSAPTGDDDKARGGSELITAAAADEVLTEQEQASATDWLLSDSAADAPIDQADIDINVGTDEEPKWIRWTVRSITPDELRMAQGAAARVARARRDDQPDELDYHAKVLAIGTVVPDVSKIAKEKGATSKSDFLKQRFNHKPGLIPQLTARIMSLSGFDDAHVREVQAGKS